jgi:hypothetical protein
MKPSGIEPESFRLVAQCVNQLRFVTGFALCPTLYIKAGTLIKFHINNFAKNATKANPLEIIPLQTTRKENNWKTEETLARAAVTVETERIKGSNAWCL